MLQDLEKSDCPDVLDIIKDKYKEYSALFSMPLTYLKNLGKYVRNVLYYTLEKHPDHTNMTWVKEYTYWLVVQVEAPQRISHNQSLNHGTRVIDRSFTFSMPEDYDCDESLLRGSRFGTPVRPKQEKAGNWESDLVEYDIGEISSSSIPGDQDGDFEEYDLGEISSIPDSPDYSDPPSDRGQEVSEVLGEGVLEDEEEEFEWTVVPPDELEIDDEVLLTNQRTASLAKTLDQVIEVFSSVSKRKSAPPSPLPDSSNWKTIQKLVLPPDEVEADNPACDQEVNLLSSPEDGALLEDEEGLHISLDHTQSFYYQTSQVCITDGKSSKESINDSVHGTMIECDVDEAPTIISLTKSPKGPRTFRYKLLKSSTSDESSPSLKQSNESMNNDKTNCSSEQNNSPKKEANSVLHSRSVGPTVRSSSTHVMRRVQTPDLSIRRIYAVRSLNDIVFSEEDYDFAAV